MKNFKIKTYTPKLSKAIQHHLCDNGFAKDLHRTFIDEACPVIYVNNQRKVTYTYVRKDQDYPEVTLDQFFSPHFFKPEFPTCWEDLPQKYASRRSLWLDRHKELCKSDEDVLRLYEADSKLRDLMRFYRDQHEEGWKPDWDTTVINHCVVFSDGVWKVLKYHTTGIPYSFPTKELAETFLKNFGDNLLEEVKPLFNS